jgi:hypothetical protein
LETPRIAEIEEITGVTETEPEKLRSAAHVGLRLEKALTYWGEM